MDSLSSEKPWTFLTFYSFRSEPVHNLGVSPIHPTFVIGVEWISEAHLCRIYTTHSIHYNIVPSYKVPVLLYAFNRKPSWHGRHHSCILSPSFFVRHVAVTLPLGDVSPSRLPWMRDMADNLWRRRWLQSNRIWKLDDKALHAALKV